MTLREKYRNEKLATLIAIIESSQDYTEEAINIIKEEIKYRKPDEGEVKKIASDLYHKKAKSYWGDFSVFQEPAALPKSLFLNKEEILTIMREEYEFWEGKREDMTINTFKYIAGGF